MPPAARYRTGGSCCKKKDLFLLNIYRKKTGKKWKVFTRSLAGKCEDFRFFLPEI